MIPNKNEVIIKTFVLPLYGIAIKSIQEVYKNAYLNKEGNYLFLEVTELTPYLANNLLYSGTFDYEERKFNLFSTSKLYVNDIQLIMSGKYSQVSQQAKNTIIQLCGLKYMVRDAKVKNLYICDEILLALIKHKSLKQKIEKTLVVELPDDSELLSKLTKEAFIDNVIIKES